MLSLIPVGSTMVQQATCKNGRSGPHGATSRSAIPALAAGPPHRGFGWQQLGGPAGWRRARGPEQWSAPTMTAAVVGHSSSGSPVLPLVAGLVLGVAIVGPGVWLTYRRRRRSLVLLKSATPSMRVRVEAWQRAKNNATLRFLSIYSAVSPPGTEPLLCVPIDAKSLAKMHAGETFDLYGDTRPGRPLALRDGEVVFAAAAKSRPGSWETKNRAPRTNIQLPLAGSVGGPTLDVPAGSVFADAAEARAWQQSSTLWRWLVPLLVVLPVIRILPPQLIVWALPVLGLVLIAEYGALWWRRRLLDRMARRLPGPPPVGRLARRAARSSARARVSSSAGLTEMAALLDTTKERLEAQQRTGTKLMFGGLGVGALVLAVVLLFPNVLDRGSLVATADRWCAGLHNRRWPLGSPPTERPPMGTAMSADSLHCERARTRRHLQPNRRCHQRGQKSWSERHYRGPIVHVDACLALLPAGYRTRRRQTCPRILRHFRPTEAAERPASTGRARLECQAIR